MAADRPGDSQTVESGRSPGKGGTNRSYPPVVALDVGTTKVACLVGELNDEGRLSKVRGLAKVAARGMHKGVVVDVEDAAACIREAVESAASEARATVKDAFVGVAGSHVVSMNRKVALNNPDEDGRVTESVRNELMEKLREVEISPEYKLIHALPRDYILDGQDGVKRPVGMWARRVEMTGHLVFGAISAIQNLVSAVEKAGLSVEDIVLEPLASSRACLEQSELQSGAMLVDIGGGTTDAAMFVDGRLVHSAVLPVGGNHITRDISVGLKVPLHTAEDIKLRYAHAQSHLVEDIEMVRAEVKGITEERQASFSRKLLARIVEARVAEIFSLVLRQANSSGYLSSIATGIVITGGSSQLEGISGLAQHIARMPARTGTPLTLPEAVDIPSNPVYATAVGLLLYGSEKISERGPIKKPEPSTQTKGIISEVLAKVKGWFESSNKA